MKTKLLPLFLLSLALGAIPTINGQQTAAHTTRLLVGAVPPYTFLPVEFPGRVRVPPSEQVWFVAPENWPYPIQWTKNDVPIEGATSRTLILPKVGTADSGFYSLASGKDPIDGIALISVGIQLEVVRNGHFGNFSARVLLQPGPDVQIVGFVIQGNNPKRVLIRAVGPTLERFGISNPANETRFRLLKSDGTEFPVVRPAVVYPPSYWSEIFLQAGAFALKAEGGERAHTAFDVFVLPPGAYTVHVSDDSGQGGQALVEVYEFDTLPRLGDN